MGKSSEEFAAAMSAAGLSKEDLQRLTGRGRNSVWRWLTTDTPPDYAWTIIRQQMRIRVLTSELCDITDEANFSGL